jgi:formylglycine-generating enzyme required for sulfatase activity
LSVAVRVRALSGTREFQESELPLVLGPGADVPLADPGLPPRAAVIGRRQGRFYLQALPGVEGLAVNGQGVAGASAWLAPGDRIAIGADSFTVETAGEVLELAAAGLEEAVTAPPVFVEQTAPAAAVPAEGEFLVPAEFRRAIRPVPAPPSGRAWRFKAAAWTGGALLAAVAAFVFTVTPVRIDVTPAPDLLAVRGGLFAPSLGGRFLLWPGTYTVVARLEGHAALAREFEVDRDGPAALRFELERLPDVYAVTSGGLEGAVVLLDGVEAGATPLEGLELQPGRYRLRVEAERHQARDMELVVEGGGREIALDVALSRDWGELVVESSPGEARVTADGVELGRTPLVAELVAGSYALEVGKAGHKPWRGEVAIEADGRVELPAIVLERAEIRVPVAAAPRPVSPATEPGPAAVPAPAAEPAPATPPERIRTGQGAELVLVRPGRFTMGASRREPGRRANENLREVELTRAFYIGTTPVTNAQFGAFDPQHRSGEAGRFGLNGERHPVVRVTWAQAAAYCNWLSAQEGLPPAYRKAGEDWVPVEPRTRGYRLPTEAEWAWAARHGGRSGEAPRYPWGAALPPPDRSGNYADESARAVLGAVIAGFQDGFPVTSPVGTFPANTLGLFDVGGNVAEWMADRYGVYPPSGTLLVDPAGPSSGPFRVIRGSSWMHHGTAELRLSYRDYGDKPRPDLGFRIARDVE